MNSSNDLFYLIKSLSKQEKRHFKLLADRYSLKKDKKYIQLFDVIEKQNEYNEEKLKKQFAKASFVKHLPVLKIQLFQLILKSLRSYHSHLSIETKLRNDLTDIDLLYKRALYKPFLKLLNKTKKMAIEFEKHQYLLECLYYERQFLLDTHPSKLSPKKNFEEERLVAEKIKRRNKFWEMLHDIMFIYKEHGDLRNAEKISALKKKFEVPLLIEEKNASTYDEKRYIYNALNIYYVTSGELHTAFQYAAKMVELNEITPNRIKSNLYPNIMMSYIIGLNNMLSAAVLSRNEEGFLYALEKMKKLYHSLPGNYPQDIKIRVFEMLYTNELYYLTFTTQFERGLEVIKKIEEGFKLFNERIKKSWRVIFCDNIATFYFYTGNFRKALFWLNKILLNENEFSLYRRDTIAHIKIFNLIIHYELENRELLESLTRSTYRFLLKQERLYKFEEIMLAFLRQLIKIKTNQQLTAAFKKLKVQLLPLTEDPNEKRIFSLFDYISWLESKIENKKFEEIARKKASTAFK